jgi:hypothetical protein
MTRYFLVLLLALPSGQTPEPVPGLGENPFAAQKEQVFVPVPPELEPLSSMELKFQGSWQGYDFSHSQKTWAFWIEGRGYRAEGGTDEWYVGRIAIDSERKPAWIDFIIDDCNCAYKGGISTGVFKWDGDSVVISAPTPDDPRAEILDEDSGDVIRLVPAEGLGMLLDDRLSGSG